MRLIEHNLKAVSTKDDLFAVLLVSLFLAVAALWLLVPGAMPAFYLVSAVMLIYAPFSKSAIASFLPTAVVLWKIYWFAGRFTAQPAGSEVIHGCHQS